MTNNNKSITEMLAPTTADPDATLTVLDVFEEKSKDADDAQKEMIKLAIEIAIGSTPVGASIRGGKVAKSTMQQLMDIAKRSGIKDHPSKWEWSKKMIGDFVHGNKISAARMKNKQILDKYKISDPDKAEFVDSITALLTRSKN